MELEEVLDLSECVGVWCEMCMCVSIGCFG